ncbi:glycosyltransferase family 2 protein [Aeromicrobium sp.]|uniref:glycosyltransferase family 2 protein n=1 Tax=Aeromicrobium sp. TaxID=1871063 RepID=UPI003D6BFD03
MSVRSRTASSPMRDLALHISKSSLTVADECMRFRYEDAPDLLARMASRGEMGYDGVLSTVHDLLEGRISKPEARAALDPYALSSLARLTAGLNTPTGDFVDVADISQAVRMIRGSVRLAYEADRIEGQAKILDGRFDSVAQILEEDLDPDTRWILRSEYEHPTRGRPGATHEAWLEAFNQRFVDQGLLPVRVGDGPGNAFDRMTVDVPDSLVVDDPDAPLVTIIMSTFKPDESFRTAVASLVAQTWRNIEILVVDDCSPPEFDGLLESVVASDPRIQLLRMPVNGGTYRIRNYAIARSRGTFVTFQDSDDWAHPERVARQVAPLLEPLGLVATGARALRVYGDLTSLRVGYNSFRRGAASLMFRKDVVIDALGGFDEVRKSADTEFDERIAAVFGPDASINLPDVLVLIQLTEGSLSRDEFDFGWHHGVRAAYAYARWHWHREIVAGRASPYLRPGAPRRVPVPTRILTGRDSSPASCDVLWVSDWRSKIERYAGSASQVAAVAGAGRSTLVAQATTVRHADRDRQPIGDEISQLQADGLTRFVIWTEPTHARLLVVTDPELLALTRPPETVSLTADRLVVVAGHPPHAPTGDWKTYDPASVERNAKRMFGVEPVWLPAHDGIADDLRDCGAINDILPARQLRAVPKVRPRPYTGMRGGSRLIVGTTALELPRRDRPSWASLRRLLPQDDDYDVRLRADPDVVHAVLKKRPVPPGWLVMDESAPLRSFLRQLDVFVAVPSRSWGPELPWSAVAALAEGAVVVIDPAYQPHLGGAAVYASAVDVHDELKALAADPDRLMEHRERGYAFCREVLSEKATVTLVDELAGFEGENR